MPCAELLDCGFSSLQEAGLDTCRLLEMNKRKGKSHIMLLLCLWLLFQLLSHCLHETTQSIYIGTQTLLTIIWGTVVISAAIETNETVCNSFWQLLNPGKAVQVGDSIG